MTTKPVALITGASRGIGAAVAKELATDHNLVLCASKVGNLDTIKQQINDINPECLVQTVGFDLTDFSALDAAITGIIEQQGRIDVFFNNAGILKTGLMELGSEGFTDVLKVNVKAPYRILEHIVPQMQRQQSGYIINLSSMSGIRPTPALGAYSISKYALTGLSANLMLALKDDGIKVTAICPSVIDTDMTAEFSLPGAAKIQVEDIAKTIRYCLSLSPNACIDQLYIQCKSLI